MPNKYLDSVGLAEYTSLVKTDLATKAPLASPALTGTPTAPTPTAGDDSTKIATTEFVNDAIDTEISAEIAAEVTRADGKYLPFAGGTLTGTVNGVTPTAGDDSTKLATTEYVQEEIRTHANMPIGHEYFTMNPNVPQGSLPLFGGEYSRETYSDLWAWVQTQTGYLKTEADWQDLSTANNGNVPYYSSGDGSTTFRVPSLRCWVKGANGTVTEVGSYLTAGLPNITGSFDVRAWGAGSAVINCQGAFNNDGLVGMQANQIVGNATGSASQQVSLNASRSSSIFGNSSTVQPPSIVGMWLVKAYGTIEDTGVIDEQQYIDDRIAAEVTRADGKYLPLAGGTMTGELTITNPIVLTDNSYNITSRRNRTDKWNLVFGGTSDSDGAYLRLDGMASNAAGSFTLKTTDGTNNSYLVGRPDGILTWNGKEVERVNTIGTNYIRFEGGLQICWGYSTADTSGTTVTFPLAFRSTGYVVMVQVYGLSLSSGLSNKTTTSVKVYSSHTTAQAGLDWIAIGLWR